MVAGSCVLCKPARCSNSNLLQSKSKKIISPARRAAFEILRRVEVEDAYASVLLSTLDESLRDDDRALCHELVLGVLRWRLWLDRTLEHFANRRMEQMDPSVRLALRLGLYQLRFLSRIPPSAAVNESVELVHAAKLRSAGTFVNAVLRRASREPEYDPAASIADADEKLAIQTSHPEWLIKRWADAFGTEEAAALTQANNQPAPTAFRFTARSAKSEASERQIIEDLKTAGAEISSSMIAPDAWRVRFETANAGRDAGAPQAKMPAPLRELSHKGLIYFQDEASQLVAHLVGARSNDCVLDVCAAPGSKTTQVSALAPAATIVAGDFFEHRLRTLNELAKQQGADGIGSIAHDATLPLPFADRSFDRVLVDAPCSGTGTLRRNPEIRWRLKPSDIAELSQKQKLILASASAPVRAAGRLVYSTCSVEPEENEDVVRNFLEEHQDFRRLRLDAPADSQTEEGAIRTWPHRHETDGFFIAAFMREG